MSQREHRGLMQYYIRKGFPIGDPQGVTVWESIPSRGIREVKARRQNVSGKLTTKKKARMAGRKEAR